MIGVRKDLLVVLVVFAGMFVFSSVSAWAGGVHVFTSSFGSATSMVKDPEPLSGPAGVAVNEKTKEVYVIDKGNDRIERFGMTGAYAGQFNGSDVPETGVFSSPNAIAVDNDPTSPSYGDIYVSDGGHHVIDKFSPTGEYRHQLKSAPEGLLNGEPDGVAVDPSGNLWVLQTVGYVEFNDAASNVSILRDEAYGGLEAVGIAVDSKDNIYVSTGLNVYKQIPSHEGFEFFLGYEGCKCVTGVAVNPATNNVYADQGTSVAEYPPFPVEGVAVEEEFGAGHVTGGSGMAVSATGTAYVADASANDVNVFEEAPKPVQPITDETVTLEGLTATLKGELRGGENTYYFAYNTNGTCTGTGTIKTPTTTATGTTTVSVTVKSLIAKTKYTFCLIAENQYGQTSGAPAGFETKASPPIIEGINATVAKVNVTLRASVNPELEPSNCTFQYGKSETYEHETPCQALGESNKNVPVSTNLTNLEPNTTYYYRITATNKTGTQQGPNETFTTEVITPTQVETAQATNITPTTAKIGGQVNPQGGATYYIEYGPPTCSLNGKPNYAWRLCATKTTEAGPLTGDTLQTVTPIEITGLTPATTYRYWIVAHNINGSERGEEATFTTPPAVPLVSPVVITPAVISTAPLFIPPAVVPTPKVTITATTVKNNTLLVTIDTTVAGTITITGSGLPKTTETLPAGTHKLTILVSKTRKKRLKGHRKITLQVTLKAGQKTATASKAVKL